VLKKKKFVMQIFSAKALFAKEARYSSLTHRFRWI